MTHDEFKALENEHRVAENTMDYAWYAYSRNGTPENREMYARALTEYKRISKTYLEAVVTEE